MDRRYIFLFIFAFGAGILFTNISGADAVNAWHIFSENYTYAYSSVKINLKSAYVFVAVKRLRLFLFTLVGSFTPFGRKLAVFLFVWLGFCLGVVNCAIAIQYGVMYFAVITLLLFSYIFLFGLFVYGMLIHSSNRRDKAKWNAYMILVFLGGVLAETLVEVKLLPAFLAYALRR